MRFDGEDHPSGRAPRRPHRLLRLHVDRAHPTARIWMNGSSRCLHGRHEKTSLASDCERSGVFSCSDRCSIGAIGHSEQCEKPTADYVLP